MSKAFIATSSYPATNQQTTEADDQSKQQQQQQQALLNNFLAAQSRFPAFATTLPYHEVAYTPTSKALIELIGGFDRVNKVLLSFYQKFNQDQYLRQFLGALQTPLECHAARFALYICEQLTGEPVWENNMKARPPKKIQLANNQSYTPSSRAGAHYCAWNSVDRKPQHVGRRFKLDDCRNWMRLMFWAMRENGFTPLPNAPSPCAVPKLVVPSSLNTSHGKNVDDEFTTTNPDDVFFAVLHNFIAHFIAVYESTAQVFTRNEAMWSANRENLDRYQNEFNFEMKDIIAQPYQQEVRKIPSDFIIHQQDLYSVTVRA